MGRRSVLAFLVLVFAAMFVTPAGAALWLVFSRTTAAPRDEVVVRTGGPGAFAHWLRTGELKRAPPLRLFLARAAVADRIRKPGDPRLVVLGKLSVDRNGTGHARFRVPNVRPGDYLVLIHCVLCGAHSFGRTIVPGGPFPGPFRVTEAPPVDRPCTSAQYGTLPANWESGTVHAGPIAFYFFQPLDTVVRRSFASVRRRRGYYRPFKVLAMVAGNRPVTVSIPDDERGRIALSYARDRLGRSLTRSAMRMVDGQDAVTFEPCESGGVPGTQFGGSFIVAGPQCAVVEIHGDSQGGSLAARLPFGRAC